MKILDKYIVSQFIAPFLAAFFIALVVLVMQFFWLYIDDIMGKGVGFFMIIEMVMYLSVTIIPMALPIAILLSSVMLFGNLGERYELATIKSSGVSLMRIMLPLIFFGIGLAGFSFYCSNNLIPVANLKFFSRLYDIRQHQPSNALEPGVFNHEFTGYTLRVSEIMPDGRGIRDVLIYDNSEIRSGIMKMMRADSGEMFLSGDGLSLIMRLYNGTQYQDLPADGRSFKPFLTTSFSEYQISFDLSAFEFQRTDEERFKTHRRMLTVGQLSETVDSMKVEISGATTKVLNPFLPRSRIPESAKDEEEEDTENQIEPQADQAITIIDTSAEAMRRTIEGRNITQRYRTMELKPVDSVNTFAERFPLEQRKRMYTQAVGFIQTHNLQLNAATQSVSSTSREMRRHIYEKHRKFAFAAVVIIFLFIGAPMGAIIRKGGFGYPLLVAILFFTLYIVLFTVFKEMNDAGTINSALSAWLAEIILFPMGLFLTIQAMRDKKILDFSGWFAKFKRKA